MKDRGGGGGRVKVEFGFPLGHAGEETCGGHSAEDPHQFCVVVDIRLVEDPGLLRGETDGEKSGEGFAAPLEELGWVLRDSQGMEIDDAEEELTRSLLDARWCILQDLPLTEGAEIVA